MLSSLLFLFAAQAGQAPPDAEALLTRTGERHFAMQAFSVEIRQQRFNPGVSMSSFMMTVHRGDGDRWRVEIGKAAFGVGTGEGWWICSHDRKSCFAQEAGPDVRMYKDRVYRAVGRFERLGQVAEGARFLRWEKIKRDLKTYDCAVIELKSPQGEEPRWMELLWIDPEERIVLRSNFEVLGLNVLPGRGTGWSPTNAGTIVSDYRWLRLDAPLSDEFFEFALPKGYRRTEPPKR